MSFTQVNNGGNFLQNLRIRRSFVRARVYSTNAKITCRSFKDYRSLNAGNPYVSMHDGRLHSSIPRGKKYEKCSQYGTRESSNFSYANATCKSTLTKLLPICSLMACLSSFANAKTNALGGSRGRERWPFRKIDILSFVRLRIR